MSKNGGEEVKGKLVCKLRVNLEFGLETLTSPHKVFEEGVGVRVEKQEQYSRRNCFLLREIKENNEHINNLASEVMNETSSGVD